MKPLLTFLFLFALVATNAQDITLPTPENLKAELVQEGTKYFVELSWDGPAEEDTLTESYYLFNNFPPDEKLYLNGRINRLNETSYQYPIKSPYAARYLFAVRSASFYPYDYKSEVSEQVEVVVPSSSLPRVRLTEVQVNSAGMLSIKWDYMEISDLNAFAIKVNDKEHQVGPEKRVIELEDSTPEENLIIEMIAITESGLESDPSNKKFVVR